MHQDAHPRIGTETREPTGEAPHLMLARGEFGRQMQGEQCSAAGDTASEGPQGEGLADILRANAGDPGERADPRRIAGGNFTNYDGGRGHGRSLSSGTRGSRRC